MGTAPLRLRRLSRTATRSLGVPTRSPGTAAPAGILPTLRQFLSTFQLFRPLWRQQHFVTFVFFPLEFDSHPSSDSNQRQRNSNLEYREWDNVVHGVPEALAFALALSLRLPRSIYRIPTLLHGGSRILPVICPHSGSFSRLLYTNPS